MRNVLSDNITDFSHANLIATVSDANCRDSCGLSVLEETIDGARVLRDVGCGRTEETAVYCGSQTFDRDKMGVRCILLSSPGEEIAQKSVPGVDCSSCRQPRECLGSLAHRACAFRGLFHERFLSSWTGEDAQLRRHLLALEVLHDLLEYRCAFWIRHEVHLYSGFDQNFGECSSAQRSVRFRCSKWHEAARCDEDAFGASQRPRRIAKLALSFFEDPVQLTLASIDVNKALYIANEPLHLPVSTQPSPALHKHEAASV
mmetsp:Transcript_2381/g.7112  ORF Transcript_2381/g.7112 Transcript_2381/m.7112 type:complete len:259 (+) Transcript_2381:644-1420(+)